MNSVIPLALASFSSLPSLFSLLTSVEVAEEVTVSWLSLLSLLVLASSGREWREDGELESEGVGGQL